MDISVLENTSDTISRQAAIDAMLGDKVQITNVIRAIGNERDFEVLNCTCDRHAEIIKALPPVQPERLTDDDFETIRIHLNAYKEKLCNQRRWEEAEEYQRIIDRFMAFASAQPKHGWWKGYNTEKEGWKRTDGSPVFMSCSECNGTVLNNGSAHWNFCPNCGADMRGEAE